MIKLLAAGRAQIWMIRAGLPVMDCARRRAGSGAAGALRGEAAFGSVRVHGGHRVWRSSGFGAVLPWTGPALCAIDVVMDDELIAALAPRPPHPAHRRQLGESTNICC